MNRFYWIGFAAMLALGAGTVGACGDDDTCNVNADCDEKHFCSDASVCVQECTTNADCDNGKSCLVAIGACTGGETPDASQDGGNGDATQSTIVTPGDVAIDVDETTMYMITGLDQGKVYRVTLVVAGNVTTSGNGMGLFIDGNDDDAADAGASEKIALITSVNDMAVDPGTKTVPSPMPFPNPTGVTPVSGAITLVIKGVATGTVYPVVYENAGTSTFLEIDDAGTPIETYRVGGAVTVTGPTPTASPSDEQTHLPATSRVYTVSGLNKNQAYRITLVIDSNITRSGSMATFVDDADGGDGAADAGGSEAVGRITSVNGMPVDPAGTPPGAKTVPKPNADPPERLMPKEDGTIEFTVTAQATSGTVHPVIYEDGGMTTFLEINDNGAPIEVYTVAGAFTVNAPTNP